MSIEITRSLMLTLVLSTYSVNGSSQEVPGCGNLSNAYGPFDYTNPTDFSERLPIVEQAHFTAEVEALRGGESSTIWDDLDYTLRAFPNHHRALYAVARYALLSGNATETGIYPAECYFTRALAFKPNDGMVHMIDGIFLHKKNKLADALEEYQAAVKLMPGSAEAHYNLGLLYTETREYEAARKHAQRAYALGYPLQGLKYKLQEAGAWN